MNRQTIELIVILGCLPIAGYLAYQWWKLLNGPDGERYLKWRTQGPFVPLSKEEIDSDSPRE